MRAVPGGIHPDLSVGQEPDSILLATLRTALGDGPMKEKNMTVKESILHILAQGGEYTRPQLAALATPSDATPKEVDAACRLLVQMDLAGEVSVRIAGGEAYYSKLKPSRGPKSRVSVVDAFSKRGTPRPVVESVQYGPGAGPGAR